MKTLTTVKAYFYVTAFHKGFINVNLQNTQLDTETFRNIVEKFVVNRQIGTSWHTAATGNLQTDDIFHACWNKQIMEGIEGILFQPILIFRQHRKKGAVCNAGPNNEHQITLIIQQYVHMYISHSQAHHIVHYIDCKTDTIN